MRGPFGKLEGFWLLLSGAEVVAVVKEPSE